MWNEVAIRIVLLILFLISETMTPFRLIHTEEMWLYKNARTKSYVPASYMWLLVTTFPLSAIIMMNMKKPDKADIIHSLLAFTLAFGINGLITNSIKLAYGRPRPDFYYRCFPPESESVSAQDDPLTLDDATPLDPHSCKGKVEDVIEGLKSFPSGHSSFSFTSLGFTSLYVAGKLRVFSSHRGKSSARLLLVLLPLLLAALVAVSRTADYHHHWQDVVVGSTLGACVAYLCYHQHYPGLRDPLSDRCYGGSASVLPTYLTPASTPAAALTPTSTTAHVSPGRAKTCSGSDIKVI